MEFSQETITRLIKSINQEIYRLNNLRKELQKGCSHNSVNKKLEAYTQCSEETEYYYYCRCNVCDKRWIEEK